MKIIKVKNYNELSALAAKAVIEQIRNRPSSVLGLATGETQEGLYKNLVRDFQSKRVDFSRVTIFNLDEYWKIAPQNPQSYQYYMRKHLIDYINLNPKNFYILNGLADDAEAECKNYELKISGCGGIDLQILGIGANGHLAFNEPGTEKDSKTRKVKLEELTRKDNSRFFQNIDEVPKYALTMGIGTILSAKKILLLAGAKKKEIVEKSILGPVTPKVPSSYLQKHSDVSIIYVL
ncbi:MAG: glucosamine-6-phosphate deaminase [Candidatus Doudnabacteria bacterium CG10_big_fil_rev_8_21_14_0_10_41_10]|uniref:Glucosamine-6-phosphate deaminase n=1 Tax=Candidatus Doudnabacteria bacterium CG10_big_fil_rev_8_21_14_0_10_41_10 TaxID=1974551 RepID=A0A2H0VD39_9BACT|nr:MAG: glucosamine-6-phosphate deaminase [Candidatus Doudnabacteria bacterium CG10_big_fil_rev_8_21_14_0_10_41_10]